MMIFITISINPGTPRNSISASPSESEYKQIKDDLRELIIAYGLWNEDHRNNA